MNKVVNGLHIRVWGEGEKVLLIHGGEIRDPGFIWSRQRCLTNDYQLIIPDRRGYWYSAARECLWTYQHDVEDMLPLLGGGAHLVGFSAGGLIALLLAEKYPTLARSLTVIEPPAFSIACDCLEVIKVIEALQPVFQSSPTHEAFLVGFTNALNLKIPQPMHLSMLQRRGVEAMMKETEPWKVSLALQTLAELTCPKLVVSGSWHSAFMVTANRLAQSIGAKRLIIKGAGHTVEGLGQLFNNELRSLIQSASSTVSPPI